MSQVCPYCRTETRPGLDSTMFCNGCGTPHHKECYDENGGCTLFGCKFAPPDEPKLAVSSGDVLGAPAPPYPQAYPVAPPPPAYPQAVPVTPPPPATGFGDVSGAVFVAPIAASPGAAPQYNSGFGDVMAGATPILQPAPYRTPPPPPPGSTPPPPPPPGVVAPPGVIPAGRMVAQPPYATSYAPRKTRIGFILLGILLGAFGAHNFYAGYHKRGLAQLLITVLTFFYGAIISWIWAIVEVCTVDRDSNGVAFS